MTAKRAAAYLRRSTQRQEQSLDRQRHEIERFARENGYAIVRWYEDDGVSGVEDLHRPGFQKLIADAETLRDFDTILVHELSRFGRFDSFQVGSWLHRLRAAKVRVRAIAGTVKDPYSREGKILLGLEQDREESIKLSMRTLSGQRETAEKGLRAGGKVPYGYARRLRRADGSVEILGRLGRAKRDKSEVVELVPGDAAEIETVQSIFRWALSGDGYRTIAARLNEMGVESPDAGRISKRSRLTGVWTTSTVRSILTNSVYSGDAIWNVRSMPRFHRLESGAIREVDPFVEGSFRINARADWIVVPNAHAPLVDRSVFDALQQRFATQPRRRAKRCHEYLLSGLVCCGNCGSVMTGTTRIRRKVTASGERTYLYPGYVCGNAQGGGACRQISIPRDGLDRAILRILDREVFAPDAIRSLEAALERAFERQAAGRGSESDRVRSLEGRKVELERQLADAAHRLLRVPDELVSDVQAAMLALKAELEGVISAIRSETVPPIATRGSASERAATVLAEIRSLAVVFQDPNVPLERRREVLRRLLPAPTGRHPITIHFDFEAGQGWKKALKRATVAHLSLRQATVARNLVAGAGNDGSGQPSKGGFLAHAAWITEAHLGVSDLISVR